MYWPIGVPKQYAASRLRSLQTTTRSDDGLSDREDAEEQGANDDKSNGASEKQPWHGNKDTEIIGMGTNRNGRFFVTITRTSLSIWQTKPVVLLTTVIRTDQSLETYGPNTHILIRPGSLILVVQTENGFLITYSLASDPSARVYQTQIHRAGGGHARQQSIDGTRRVGSEPEPGAGEAAGIQDVSIRFRMVIRIDAGISKALALEEELLVATEKPAALQSIRWSPDSSGASHHTELLRKMPWLAEKSKIVDMVHDRPMGLHVWTASDGRVYAVQRRSTGASTTSGSSSANKGYCFHDPESEDLRGSVVAVNARFSLIAVACQDASVHVYTAKDYLGNIPYSHTLRLPVSTLTSGSLNTINYSPDGYCLLAGYEKGWALWSVYGKLGANSFGANQEMASTKQQRWLGGVTAAFWIGGGCELVLLGPRSDELSVMEMARSSMVGCFNMASVSRSLLQTSTSVIMYRGLQVSDVTMLSGETDLWHTIQLPLTYVASQWPIVCSVISPEGRYIAVSGRRGLAHYSLGSGRWKTFGETDTENSFAVRGGLCWYQHILVAAVEAADSYEIRLYSREKALDASSVLHTETFEHPIIHITTSGTDSLLVYTHENILYHYLFIASGSSVKVALVGQIAFHGIIRAPTRVRAVNWIVPDEQREQGEPSQDVATAAVLFLIDGKLVLLQPSANEHGDLKYDMRVIAQDVEHYSLNREQMSAGREDLAGQSLQDSLWFFNGKSMRVWPDILDVVASAPNDLKRELPPSVSIPTDFYPLSASSDRGLITGLESDLSQRRTVDFAYHRFNTRTQLFIPSLLRHHLERYDSTAALHLSDSYQNLPYFAHALEMLLHDVLDDEVDAADTHPKSAGDTALLGSVLSFLSSFTAYLDIVVSCARKTELRSWRTLFHHLPPVHELFEESLRKGLLKTAGGYLLVLHTFEEEHFNAQQSARLLRLASQERDWELCKELARFLVGIDESGGMLRQALEAAGLTPGNGGGGSPGVIMSRMGELKLQRQQQQNGHDYFGLGR